MDNEEDDGNDNGRAEREPAGIGTDVSRLHAACEPAEAASAARKCGSGALNDEPIDQATEYDAREHKQRRNNQTAVDLIDPVLVIEEVIERLVVYGERGCGTGLAVVEHVGEVETDRRSENGDEGQQWLRAA